MARKRFSAEQIMRMLRDAEVLESKSFTQAKAVRQDGVCKQTLIWWKQECGGFGDFDFLHDGYLVRYSRLPGTQPQYSWQNRCNAGEVMLQFPLSLGNFPYFELMFALGRQKSASNRLGQSPAEPVVHLIHLTLRPPPSTSSKLISGNPS